MAQSTFESSVVADCAFSVAADYAEAALAHYGDASTPTVVSLPFRSFGLPFAGDLKRNVGFVFEPARDEDDDRNRSGESFAFAWSAGSALLPNLRGRLGFRIAPDLHTQVVLRGSYEPPLGAFGAVFDRLLGQRFAQATGDALLARIAADMETRERDFRRDVGESADPDL